MLNLMIDRIKKSDILAYRVLRFFYSTANCGFIPLWRMLGCDYRARNSAGVNSPVVLAITSTVGVIDYTVNAKVAK